MTEPPATAQPRIGPDWPFTTAFWLIGSLYLALILAMVAPDSAFTSPSQIARALGTREIQYAIKLSLISCTISALLSLIVAVPLGYLLSRHEFRGQSIDEWLRTQLHFPVTFAIPSVILAQFAVACAFAVRTMRVTFEQINPRNEQVALTLGCTRSQAFWLVALPEARRGILTAATLAWARSLGEFGPILMFSGATRMRTEVLPTTVFLELSIGNIEAAVAVSLLMIAAAAIVLTLLRVLGSDSFLGKAVEP